MKFKEFQKTAWIGNALGVLTVEVRRRARVTHYPHFWFHSWAVNFREWAIHLQECLCQKPVLCRWFEWMETEKDREWSVS